MQQLEDGIEQQQLGRGHTEAIVKTLVDLRSQGESLAEVAHDARNMMTAIGLYCDLLDEPGVLAPTFAHYGGELRLVAAASRRLVEKLVLLDNQGPEGARDCGWIVKDAAAGSLARIAATPIANLAGEVIACGNLLAALAGPAIALSVTCKRGELPVRLTGEDLTRLLVNLVKNAAEAMPSGGRIQISLRESPTAPGVAPWVLLTVEDNGPGIAQHALECIFENGYTTRTSVAGAQDGGERAAARRGMGLAIARALVEAAGGRIHAANRDPMGACFQVELPVRTL